MIDKRSKSARPVTPIVKSTARTLEILEFFDDTQRPANVVTISAALNYPQSSTSALLRSLVGLGYLQFDSKDRTYFPTERVPLLGSWLNPPLFREASLQRMLRAIGERTGKPVLLATRQADHVQYIHVLAGADVDSPHTKTGTTRPLAASGAGLALLSLMPDAEVKGMFHRLNAYARTPADLVPISDLLAMLAVVRRDGYAFAEHRVVEGYGMIGVPMPDPVCSRPLVVGVAGKADQLRAALEVILSTVQEEIRRYLGGEASRGQASGERNRSACLGDAGRAFGEAGAAIGSLGRQFA